MKILINCVNLLSGLQGAGGAGSYVYFLIIELAKLETVRVLIKPSNFLRFQKIKNLEVVPLLANNIEQMQEHFLWADIYFCPLNELVPCYLDTKIPVVSTIHDLQHEVYPHYFKNGVYESRRTYYGYAISRANAIITVSNNEKNLLQRIYNKKDVYVTYHSGYLADKFVGEAEKNKISQFRVPEYPYIIYPAIPWRHKNHYRLVEALWLLKQSHPAMKDLKLILTGAQHSLSSSSLENLISDLQIQDSIEMKGFVSNLELAALIKNANLMVFPSLYEGFGIPILDAMKLGTPVLANALPAIIEIAGDSISYLQNPLDSKQIAQDIHTLLNDKGKCLSLVELAYQQGSKYSSIETAKSTISAFSKVIEQFQKSIVKLDYINVKDVPEHRSQIKSKRISLIFDFTRSEFDESQFIQYIDKLALHWQDLVKVVAILPVDKKITLSEVYDHIVLKVYSDSKNQSYYHNSFNYLFDAVIDTKYVMYCELGCMLKYQQKIDLVEGVTIMDTFSHFDAIIFTEKVKFPTETLPLSNETLLKEYDYWKSKRLSFFNLTILRTDRQDGDYHIGQYKFLSKFLSESVYLKYPII